MSDRRTDFEAWGNSAIDLWERVYKILRGLPHHRLALLTVSVGAAILAGPFWEPIVRALAEAIFTIRVDPPIEPIYGIALIVLGLTYHFLMTWLAAQETIASKTRDAQIEDRVRAHDVPIFLEFQQQAPENQFKSAMSSIRDDHSYTSTQSSIFVGVYYFLTSINNNFNDTELQKKADTLKDAVDTLTDFTANHFSVYGPLLNGNVLRFVMRAEWNIDRGGNPSHQDSLDYSGLTAQLTPMVQAVLAAYEDFVRTGQRRVL